MVQKHGKVAGSLNSTNFKKANIKAGKWGEQQTASHIYKNFPQEPKTHIFHDLKVPNLNFANIDHVLVRGDCLFVIDSKNWAAGTYWNIGKKGFRGFKPFNGLTKQHVQAACAHYKQKFPHLKVIPVVAVWTKNTKKKHVFLTYGLGITFIQGNKLSAFIKKNSTYDKPEIYTIQYLKGTLI